MVDDAGFFFSPLKNSSYSEWISPTEPEPRRARPAEEGTSHPDWVIGAGYSPGPSGLRFTWSCDAGLLPLGGTRPPRSWFVRTGAHRVVEGSFLTRRWARIEDSIGFSCGVGLELLSAEYVAAMAP